MSGSMREMIFGDPEDRSEDHGPIIRLLLAIRGSFLLFTVSLGIAMILSGFVVDVTFANQGVIAAMLVIWGISAIIYGMLGFVFILGVEYR